MIILSPWLSAKLSFILGVNQCWANFGSFKRHIHPSHRWWDQLSKFLSIRRHWDFAEWCWILPQSLSWHFYFKLIQWKIVQVSACWAIKIINLYAIVLRQTGGDCRRTCIWVQTQWRYFYWRWCHGSMHVLFKNSVKEALIVGRGRCMWAGITVLLLLTRLQVK